MPEESQPQSESQNPPAFVPPAQPQQPAATPVVPVASVQSPVQSGAPVVESMTEPQLVSPQLSPVAYQAPIDDSKQWISKDEYQRLQQAEVAAQAMGSGAKPEKLFGTIQIVTAAIAAISLIIGLIASQSSYFGGMLIWPSLVMLTLMGIFTWHDYAQASKAGGYIKRHKARNVFFLVCSIIILTLPILLPVAILCIIMIVCVGGGCKGS